MIGKTFKRLLPVSALALAASAAMNAGNAQAILVYEFLEEGADVRLNISGSLTLPSPPAFDSFTSTTTSIRTGGSSFKIAANPLGKLWATVVCAPFESSKATVGRIWTLSSLPCSCMSSFQPYLATI
jgi:hypothetical protein